MKLQIPVLLLLAVLLAMLQSCSGTSNTGGPQPGDNQSPKPQAPAGDNFIDSQVLRDTSGKITGIQISWEPVPDNAAEKVVGYHIYKSNETIPASALGDSSFWVNDPVLLEDGEGNNTIFAHTALGEGEKFSYIDPAGPEFPLNLGESWFYRLTAVNEGGDESGLSPEVRVDVTMHIVDELSSTSLGVGAELVISGRNFGQYDDTTDEVFLIGHIWNDTTHVFDQTDISATILDWQPSEITIEIPSGATKGRIKVSIDGLVAQSFDLFENSDPYITEISPYERFLDQNLLIKGANFGSAQDASHFVVANDTDQDTGGNYSIYTDAAITLTLEQGTAFGEVAIQVEVGGVRSNTGYMFLKNRAPVAAFSMNQTSGKVPVQINFNASGSSDVEGPIVKYTMDFGDGSPPAVKLEGETPTFSHIFNKAGSWDVVLTVEDEAGLEDTEQKTVSALPSAEVLLVENIDNGQGVGNQYVPNVAAIRDDVGATGLNLDYISGGYSEGIGQVAIDSGVKVVIWFRGGPGLGDPIQDWPRNWSESEKSDLLAILNNGTDVLLISQNHQFTGDDTSGNDWNALYGLTKQTDRIQEPPGERPFTWMFGAPTDITYSHNADSIPSSPVCLNGTFPAGVVSVGAAEAYNGTGSSGNIPTGLNIVNNRIQMGLAVDLSMIGNEINANFVPGTVVDEGTYPFKLCYSHGLTTAPDSNIGFSGGGYSHNNGTARLWVIGWSYSEMTPVPGTVSRQDVLQNILAWLDSSLTLP